MGRQLQRWGRQPIILANFPQNLHENEKIGPREEGVSGAPLDPPMDCSSEYEEHAKFKILALHVKFESLFQKN